MNHKTHYNPTTICSQTISSPNMTRQCFHQMNRSIFHGHCSRRLGIGQMRGDRITFLRWIIDRVIILHKVQIICYWLKKLREPQNPFSDWRLFNVSVLLNDTLLKALVRPMVPAVGVGLLLPSASSNQFLWWPLRCDAGTGVTTQLGNRLLRNWYTATWR